MSFTHIDLIEKLCRVENVKTRIVAQRAWMRYFKFNTNPVPDIEKQSMLRALWKSQGLTPAMKRAIFHKSKPMGCVWI